MDSSLRAGLLGAAWSVCAAAVPASARPFVEPEGSDPRGTRTAQAHSHREPKGHLHSHAGHGHGPPKTEVHPHAKPKPMKAKFHRLGGSNEGHGHRGHSGRSPETELRPSIDQGHQHAHSAEAEAGHAHGIETENLFGFVLGSDTEEAGARGVALENIGRLGKRAGSYFGLGQKLEFSFGATDDLSVSFSLLGDYHHLRNVPGFDDVRGRYVFNGFGAEMRWRLLDRKTSPFGLTLHLEPSVGRIDEVSGQAGSKLGSENKLILDRELLPDTLFGAINVIYDIERMKERRANFVTERAATAGIGGALAFKISDDLFLGGEARYLRAYEGFSLKKWQGHAVYLGPTLFARFLERGWISAAWNVQVAGREAIDRAGRAEALTAFSEAAEAALAAGDPAPTLPNFGRRSSLDLANFERHQFRLKVGFEF